MEYVASFLVAGAVFGILDALWLSLVANSYYKKHLGKLLREKPDMIAAISFYVIYLVGLVVFVLIPSLMDGSLSNVIWRGALFGFVCYATYDLTNLATLKGFPRKLVVVDLLWGIVATTMTAVTAFLLVRMIGVS